MLMAVTFPDLLAAGPLLPRCSGLGLGDLGFRGQGLGFGVQGLRSLGFRGQGLGSLGFRDCGFSSWLGLRV